MSDDRDLDRFIRVQSDSYETAFREISTPKFNSLDQRLAPSQSKARKCTGFGIYGDYRTVAKALEAAFTLWHRNNGATAYSHILSII